MEQFMIFIMQDWIVKASNILISDYGILYLFYIMLVNFRYVLSGKEYFRKNTLLKLLICFSFVLPVFDSSILFLLEVIFLTITTILIIYKKYLEANNEGSLLKDGDEKN